MRTITLFLLVGTLLAEYTPGLCQPNKSIKVEIIPQPVCTINFNDKVLDWDGFGVNYVETAQTRDYKEWQQDYSGFSILSEGDRQRILELIFGTDGLKPGITKLFLDPFHQQSANSNFDHTTTTKWMLYFNRQGLQKTRARGDDLTMLTTLYSPPSWTTKQNFVLGRDLDPAKKADVARYLISWVKYLRDNEKFRVKYLSLHNEGDAYYRWPKDGSNGGEDHRDYNMLWKPEQVVDFLKLTKKHLSESNLNFVGVTPGETQNWYRFDMWGYARAIAKDKEALRSLGLITSHSFANTGNLSSIYYGDFRSNGIDVLQKQKPNVHAWTTSMPWGKTGGVDFIDAIARNIYIVKSNGIIPWALVQRGSQWIGGDPNPVTAFKIKEDSTFTVEPGYYYYKQVSRAGQPGMYVASVTSLDPSIQLIAFAKNNTKNANSFVVLNISENEKEATIHLKGNSSTSFTAVRTSPKEKYTDAGNFTVTGGAIQYKAPPLSVTTFYETNK